MSFKIRFEGLDRLKKELQVMENPEEKLSKASGLILDLHSQLDKRIQALYNVPYGLDRARIGRTVPIERIGKTLLRFSLQYRHIPVPLGDYKVKTSASSSLSSAPTRIPPDSENGYVKWKRGAYSTDSKVAIRKGRAKLQGTAGKGAKGSYAFRTPGNSFLVRRIRQTWHVRPTLGVIGTRTKLQIMYGPSLSALAAQVYEKDYVMQQEIDKLSSLLVDILD